MKISEYFQELIDEYPIADILNKEVWATYSYNGTKNKIDICEEIMWQLEDKFQNLLIEKNLDDDKNWGIACDFAAEPYFNNDAKNIKYKYVFIVYFCVLYPDFAKRGFYYQGRCRYYIDGTGKVEDTMMPKKSIQPLLLMAHELNGLVSKFLMDNLEI